MRLMSESAQCHGRGRVRDEVDVGVVVDERVLRVLTEDGPANLQLGRYGQ